MFLFFFFKQKTAYEMRISDWSSDVFSSDLLKEFWHVGRDLPAGHRLAAQQPNNVWPDEVDGFRATFETLFAAFDRVGGRLLSGIARYLGLAPDFFDDTVRDGNSVMRLLHYPPIGQASFRERVCQYV